jgi:hypothetical protein
MSGWILCSDRLPESGQKVWYFGILGLWRGTYHYQELTHWVSCDEEGNEVRVPPTERDARWWILSGSCYQFSSGGGNCSTEEVTHWCPDDREDGWAPLPPGYVEWQDWMFRVRDGNWSEVDVPGEVEAMTTGHKRFI